jgi:hypothetical protein
MHVIGQDPKTTGTSAVVMQFMAIIRGEIQRHVPRQAGVQQIRAEFHYCYGCFGNRVHDVVYGSSDHILDVRRPHRTEFRIAYCRVCGKEGAL